MPLGSATSLAVTDILHRITSFQNQGIASIRLPIDWIDLRQIVLLACVCERQLNNGQIQ